MSEKCRVILFTRYPEPGSTKTRLIPMLGADRAADLQRQLTVRAIATVRNFVEPAINQRAFELRYSAGSAEQMEQMFGTDLQYRQQVGEDLGERLTAAMEEAFDCGCQSVIIIGADCPRLSTVHLERAKQLLRTADVVIGPAIDGGYYLIAMSKPQSKLFVGIDWGTEKVLQQTLTIARSAGLKVQQTEQLSDVDYPEDLVQCRHEDLGFHSLLGSSQPGMLSIIIPTFNEAKNIERTLGPLIGLPATEVIVTDGGSSDETVKLAESLGAQVIRSRPGRGVQMNTGAAIAKGEYLLFLHADTNLPDNFRGDAEEAIAKGASAVAFRLNVDSPKRLMRVLEAAVAWRSRWLQRPYGDQGLFLAASTFFAIGGFRNWPLMEDYEITERLRAVGPIGLLRQAAVTSPRRWNRLGIFRTAIRNQCCVWGYRMGVSTDKLAEWYRR